jgi:hypothetical protein
MLQRLTLILKSHLATDSSYQPYGAAHDIGYVPRAVGPNRKILSNRLGFLPTSHLLSVSPHVETRTGNLYFLFA